jgi:alkylation response protein AidB-like acyl-CoA dehydrogenase
MSTETEDRQDELRLLRESVRTLFERAGGVGRARKLRRQGFDPEIMRALGEAGVFGAAVPEDRGGLGMGLVAAGVVAEEAGRVLAPEPVVATIGLAIGLLQRLAPKHEALAAALAGSAVYAPAFQERGPRGPEDHIACRFAEGRLSGAKAWVVGSRGAAGYLVVAQSASGSVLALAGQGAAGLVVKERPQADGSVLAELAFSNTPAEALAEGEAVTAALAEAVADAQALTAAELAGLSRRAFEITLDYIKTREQFDQPVGGFQALQHRAVDLYVMQEVAEAGIREALARMDRDSLPAQRTRHASRAKARGCVAARKITREAIQLHGAVGYTDEFDIGLYLNRALVLSAWLGDDTHHRRLWLEGRDAEEAANER